MRTVDVDAALGAGILHSKFILVDSYHFYLGSANMDWRSLTEVKELGVVGTNCPCIVRDIEAIFLVYTTLADSSYNLTSPPFSHSADLPIHTKTIPKAQ